MAEIARKTEIKNISGARAGGTTGRASSPRAMHFTLPSPLFVIARARKRTFVEERA